MIFTEEDYPSWKTIAEDARQALIVLHHDVPQCLPGEPGACGGTFAEHTIAYLATLRARVDFEIEHLGQAAQPAIQVIYRNMITEIRAREDCGDPEHQPVPGKEA